MEDVAAHNRISERATLRWIDIPFLDNPNFQGFTTPAALEEHLQKLAEHRAVLGRPLHKRNKDGSFGTHTGRSLVQYLGKLVQEQACTPQQRTSSLFRSHGSAALTEAFRTTLDWSPERAWGTDEDEVAFETACLQAARPMESGDDGFFETLREGDLSRRCSMLPDNPSCHKDKSTGLMRREETGRRPLCKSCCRWLSLKKLALIPCYNASVASQSQVCRKNGHTRMKGKVYCRPCYNAARHQGSSARFFEPGLARKPKTDSAAAAAATAVQVGPDLTSTPFAFPDPASPRVPPTESPLSNPEDAGSPRSIQAANLKRSRVSVDDDETDEGTIKLEGASNAGQAPARKVAKHHYNFQSLSTGLKAVAIDTDISNSNLNDQWTTLRKKLSSTVVQHLQDFDQDASRTADSSPRIVKAADPPQSLRHAYSAAFGNSDVSIYPTTKGLGAVIGYLIYDLVFSRALDIIRLPEKLLCDVEAEATHWGIKPDDFRRGVYHRYLNRDEWQDDAEHMAKTRCREAMRTLDPHLRATFYAIRPLTDNTAAIKDLHTALVELIADAIKIKAKLDNSPHTFRPFWPTVGQTCRFNEEDSELMSISTVKPGVDYEVVMAQFAGVRKILADGSKRSIPARGQVIAREKPIQKEVAQQESERDELQASPAVVINRPSRSQQKAHKRFSCPN